MSEVENETLSEVEYETLSEVEYENMLTETKTQLVRTFPFLAFVVISTNYLIIKEGSEDTKLIKTMAATVIGSQPTVLVNPMFMANTLKSPTERTFVIAHELLHLFFQHLGRQSSRGYKPELWNVATDYFINYLLDELDSANLDMPSLCLYDKKYADMSSDAIYQLLVDEADGCPDKAMSSFGEAGSGAGAAMDEVSGVELTSDQKAELRAALSASMNGGQMGGDLRNSALVKELYNVLEPTQPWREVLADFVTNSRNESYSYKRYNSRSGEIIFPSSSGDKINLVFGIDTSGSMSTENLCEGLTELRGIVSDFQNWEIDFVTCETQVELVGKYSSEQGDDIVSFSTDFMRGGGTDMNPILLHAEQVEETPDAVIIITDGYLSEPLISTQIPTIVVVVRGGVEELETNHSVIYIK